MAEAFNLHQAVGGTEAWRQLAEAFYSRVARDPVLRPLFPGKTQHCAIEELTAFMTQLFGGPSADTQRRWWLSLSESHRRFKIGPQERAAWMENMRRALEDLSMAEPLRRTLLEFFEHSSAHVLNTGDSIPSDSSKLRPEIARCWGSQLTLDEAVAAIRTGQASLALTAAESLRTHFQRDPSVLAGLYAQMLATRDPSMLRYVQERITHHPAVVHERYAGRTLLHEASAQGDLAMVEFLLRLAADPHAQTPTGHTPLYCLANQCVSPDGAAVVRALARSGANVNASDNVKRCTPLHMAARRGNVQIAEALLDNGAIIDPRDSLGDTPLRRSVNCNKLEVASLLLSRGADVRSIGNKSLTPLQAAKTPRMKELLAST